MLPCLKRFPDPPLHLPCFPSSQRTNADREEDFRASVRWAVNLNFVINILLLGAKIAVVLLSHSMSLVASTVDSAMDFLSTLIIFYTSKVIEHKDWKSQYSYPSGSASSFPFLPSFPSSAHHKSSFSSS